MLRRAASFALFLLLAAPVLLPFAQVGAASAMPACCRRNGNHHCANSALGQTLTGEDGPSGPEVRNPVPRCPYRGALAVSHSQEFIPFVSAAYSAAASSRGALHLEAENAAHLVLFCSHLQRGPPVLV